MIFIVYFIPVMYLKRYVHFIITKRVLYSYVSYTIFNILLCFSYFDLFFIFITYKMSIRISLCYLPK